MEKHGSGKIYQVMTTVAGSRDLDLNLAKGELVAVMSEADTRGDKRRWLVDAGSKIPNPLTGACFGVNIHPSTHPLSNNHCLVRVTRGLEPIPAVIMQEALIHPGQVASQATIRFSIYF